MRLDELRIVFSFADYQTVPGLGFRVMSSVFSLDYHFIIPLWNILENTEARSIVQPGDRRNSRSLVFLRLPEEPPEVP